MGRPATICIRAGLSPGAPGSRGHYCDNRSGCNPPRPEMVQSGPGVDVRVFPRGRFSKLWTGFSRPLARFIKSEAAYYDVIHVHEMWHYPQHVASHEARKRNIPLVVSPRGCLTPLALANDRLLKIAYTRLVQRRILEDASLLHALTGRKRSRFAATGYPPTPRSSPRGLSSTPAQIYMQRSTAGRAATAPAPSSFYSWGGSFPTRGLTCWSKPWPS